MLPALSVPPWLRAPFSPSCRLKKENQLKKKSSPAFPPVSACGLPRVCVCVCAADEDDQKTRQKARRLMSETKETKHNDKKRPRDVSSRAATRASARAGSARHLRCPRRRRWPLRRSEKRPRDRCDRGGEWLRPAQARHRRCGLPKPGIVAAALGSPHARGLARLGEAP
jgi:hypothetical protein